MPYPLLKLQYGMRRRLGELSTSAERYNFQTAAHSVAICPPDLQQVNKKKPVTMEICNGEIYFTNDYGTPQKPFSLCPNDQLILYENEFIVIRCALTDLDSAVFSRLILRPRDLRLSSCNLSTKFLQKLSRLTASSVTAIIIDNSIYHSLFNIKDLVTYFPKLRSLAISYPKFSHNWMSEILKVEKHCLEKVTLINYYQAMLFNFKQLIEFIKAQKAGFSLIFDQHYSVGTMPVKPCDFNELKWKLDTYLPSFEANYFKSLFRYNQIVMGHGEDMITWCVPSEADIEKHHL